MAAALILVMIGSACDPVQGGPRSAGGRLVVVAFSVKAGFQRVVTMRPDGSDQRAILSRPFAAYGEIGFECPRWSPDGRRILLTIGPSQHGSLYVINADGTGLRQVARESAYGLCGSWSPDGRMIAFSEAIARRPWAQVFIKDLSTGAVTRLTRGAEPCYDPSWSPDGHQIAFSSGRGVYTYVFVKNLATGATRQAEPWPVDGFGGWSPDGTRLLITRLGGIWAVDVATGAITRLASGSWPSWSPNGDSLAFEVTGPSGYRDIYAGPVSGARPTRLTNSAATGMLYNAPSWGR